MLFPGEKFTPTPTLSQEERTAFRLMVLKTPYGGTVPFNIIHGMRLDAGAGHHFEKCKCTNCDGTGRVTMSLGRTVLYPKCPVCNENRWIIELRRDDGKDMADGDIDCEPDDYDDYD